MQRKSTELIATVGHLCYDPYALSMYRNVRKAVDDWLEAKAAINEPVEEFLAVKLGFAFTDLRRFSHFAMRGAQYLEALTPADRSLFNAAQREVNVWECAAGVHWWLRQVSLHAGFYHFLHELEGVNDKGAEADCMIAAESARPEYPDRKSVV